MSNLKYKHTAYTSAQWASLNPVIVENEIVIESDTKRTKIGNGISTYNELEYADANSVGNSLGSIKPTDAAPTPARNGNYTFSIGGTKPAWLTAEALVTEVRAGDGVAVVYSAPSSYTYTHVDTGSSIEGLQQILDEKLNVEDSGIKTGIENDGHDFADSDGNVIFKLDENGANCKYYNICDENGNILKTISAEFIDSILTTDSEALPTKFATENLLYQKNIYSVCDSLGTAGVWMSKLAELSGASFDKDVNYKSDNADSLSWGGTPTMASADGYSGQNRIKKLKEIDADPYLIIYENVNDANFMTDTEIDDVEIADCVPFMWSQFLTPLATVFSSQTAARAYWNANYASILASVATNDRKIGTTLLINYTTASIILTVTQAASANGNYQFSIGSNTYSIAITAGMTISQITTKIYEIAFSGYSKSTNSTNTVTLTYTGIDAVGAYALISYNSTGILVTSSTSSTTSNVNIWFNSKDINDWEILEKWEQWRLNLYSHMRGLIEYVKTEFPNALFYWLIPTLIGTDFNASTYKRADGSWDIDLFLTATFRNENLKKMQRKICDYYGIPILDMDKNSNINLFNITTFGNSGNVHPKDVAYERWGETIFRLIK